MKTSIFNFLASAAITVAVLLFSCGTVAGVHGNGESNEDNKVAALHYFAEEFYFPRDFENLKTILLYGDVDKYHKGENNANFLHEILFPFDKKRGLNSEEIHEIVKFLINRKFKRVLLAKSGSENSNILQLFAGILNNEEPSKATLKLLHDLGINFNYVNSDGKNVLSYAIYVNRSIAFLENLVELGADVFHVQKETKETLLHLATSKGTTSAMEFLLKKGLDSNAENKWGQTPMFSLVRGHVVHDFAVPRLQILKEAGADFFHLNYLGIPIIAHAVLEADGKTLEYLYKNGFNVNEKVIGDEYPIQAIMHPVIAHDDEGQYKMMVDRAEALISLGADLSVLKSPDGDTLLHIASETGTVEIMKLFIDNGLDPNARNFNGDTPLHKVEAERFAKDKQKSILEKVKLLLASGVDAHAMNDDGEIGQEVIIRKFNSEDPSSMDREVEGQLAFKKEMDDLVARGYDVLPWLKEKAKGVSSGGGGGAYDIEGEL